MIEGDSIIRDETKQPAVMAEDDRFILECKAITEKLSKKGLGVARFQAPSGVSFAGALKGDNRGAIIGAADTVVELGHPITASVCLGIVTERKDLIAEDRVTVIGKELEELTPGRHSFAFIMLAQAKPGEATRHALMKHVLSFDLLAGCMIRASSNRIWIRFSQDALDHRLTLKDMGAFLLTELKNNGFGAAEIILVTGTAEQVSEIGAVADEMAEERNGRFREALVDRMACETGLDCDECPETDTCKVLKDAVAVARRKRSSAA